jgi:hypothetical protein
MYEGLSNLQYFVLQNFGFTVDGRISNPEDAADTALKLETNI